jgi:hypothetical protein
LSLTVEHNLYPTPRIPRQSTSKLAWLEWTRVYSSSKASGGPQHGLLDLLSPSALAHSCHRDSHSHGVNSSTAEGCLALYHMSCLEVITCVCSGAHGSRPLLGGQHLLPPIAINSCHSCGTYSQSQSCFTVARVTSDAVTNEAANASMALQKLMLVLLVRLLAVASVPPRGASLEN